MKNLNKVIEISYALSGKYPFRQRCKHFSFIFDRNRLLSIGMNSPKTHPLNLKYNYINKQHNKISMLVGTHSELSAVIKLGYENYEGFTLINTRINRNDKLDYSHPCNGCMDMLKQLGFKKVYYTNKNSEFEFIEI